MYIRKKKILAGGGRDGPKRILSLLGIVLVLSGTMVTSIFPAVSVSAAENTEVSADAVHEHEVHYHSDDGTAVYYDDADDDVSVAAADAITVIDVTGLATGEETSHDCQKYLTTKYDDNNHWQECTVCGNKFDVEKHELTRKWAFGYESCESANHYNDICDCGYISPDGMIPCKWDGVSYVAIGASLYHYRKCSVHEGYICDKDYIYNGKSYRASLWNDESDYQGCVKADGSRITCNNPGTCIYCGYTCGGGDHRIGCSTDENGEQTLRCNFCGEVFGTAKMTTSCYQYSDSEVMNIANVQMHLKDGVSFLGGVTYWADYQTGIWDRTATGWGTQDITYIVSQKTSGNFKANYGSWSDFHLEINGVDCLGSIATVPSCYLIADCTAPVITDISVKDISSIQGWSTGKQITVSGTDNYADAIKVNLLDNENNVIYSGQALTADKHFSLSFIPDIEADVNGKEYKIMIEDQCWNTAEKSFMVYKTDKKIPTVSSSDATSTDWAKSKDVTFTATDEGSGNVQIAFNKADEYAAAIKNSNTYSRRYRLVGDVYGSTQAAIYYKDLVGNETTGFVTISNIDNTAPTITKADLLFGDTVTLTVNANDNKDFGGPVGVKSGSGVVSYAISTDKNNPGVFQNNSIFTIPATGDYYVFARDAVGNIGMYHYGIITMSYDVTYNANGGTGIMNKGTAVYGRKFTIVDSDLTKTGYSFSGWNTRADGSGTDYDAGDVINPYKNRTGMTLYAQWKSNKYTITFNLNKPARASSIPVLNARATMEVEYDTIITGLPDKTVTLLTGWTFAGWYTRAEGGTEVKSGDVYNWPDNITLYAHWIENTYVVHYNSDGGTASQNINVKYEEPVTLLSAPFRPGYSFLSWNTRQDGLGTSYSASQSVTHLTTGGTVNLYGMWDRKSLMKIGAAVNTTVNNGYVFGRLSDESSVPVRTYIIDENGTIQK